MRIIFASLALLALSLEAYAQPAAKAPEALLTAECIAYFRYDGYEPHRKAYDETAVAMAMKEGLSEFFEHVLQQIPLLINGTALRGNAKKDEPPRPQLDGFFDCLSKHGFVLGLEAAPPGRELRDVGEMFHVTIVFPHGADKKHRDALEKVFQLLAGALETPIAETSHAGRMVRSVPYADTHLAWWAEGPHLVCCVGTQPIGRTMAVVDGRQPNLTAAAWYKEFASFKRYETDMRGYVDLAAIMDRVAIFGLEAQSLENYKERITRHMLMRHLGLTGLKDLTFHLGFDGKYQRSTVRLGVVEPKGRTGLLRLASGPIAYSVDKLPPLPPDADYVSVRHLDWGNVYDYIRTSYGLASIANLIKHHELPTRFPDLDQMIGGDFRKDFLDQLDTTVITYGGHSEGPFFLGQGFAVKVKDATKVRKGLAGLSAALGKIDDMFVAEKTTFRGQEMHSLSKLYLPVTYAVHNDWLIGGLFPQPVQGVILRSGGKYRAWKVPPEAQFALAKAENGGNKLIGASISDPRPVVQFGLSLLPIYAHVINKSVGTKVLDVNKFPNAQAVNEWLFPNTTMAYDDGNALRWEHHYSINEPDDFLLLLTIPYAAMLTDILPFRRVNPRANERVQPAFEPLPPPRRIPPEGDDKQPIMCRATAIEKDGAVQIRVEATRKVAYTVTSKEPFTISEKVLMNGVERTITKTAYRDVQAMHLKDVAVKSVLIADGKKVRVTRKDGVPVDAKDILASLEKSTQVVQGIGLTDIELVTWFPNQTQTYRVVVRNLGSTWNRYSMATN